MIVGIGVDVVSIERIARALERTPRFEKRVFTDHELSATHGRAGRTASLAARFAAKEACRKALRTPLPWRDVEVVTADDGAPSVHVAGRDDLRMHVSLSHDAGVAIAMVVAERGA